MAAKPEIAIVGPGRLGSALARELVRAGYRLSEIISRDTRDSRKKARELARITGSRAATVASARALATLIWFCVPDREIASAAEALAGSGRGRKKDWQRAIAFHSSGALTSDQLEPLGRRGASVASVHPLMTFVEDSTPPLGNVPFAIEGDPPASRLARQIVGDLGGQAFLISKADKPAYHALATLTSPLVVAMLTAAEEAARAVGLSAADARRKLAPMVRQTVANYFALGPERAFTGPLARGEIAVIGQHLKVLKALPQARTVYLALARVALRKLPVENRKQLNRLLAGRAA
jgi:predicted short-subunit dehydrogenase-like oxidoreductase (DUF2520 family)